ncbi:MAG: hypothetical protein LLG20_00300 [Acidobacteriales bacterium]|nr:hypothetical protein [Terriglobales bacterium]
MRGAIRLAICLPALAVCLAAQPQSPKSELDKAVEEFKVLTRNLGIRPDSPPKARSEARAKMAWHGRLFENWRNDVMDAVPHEIVQRGGNKSLLRRNQFGFNVSGPVWIPRLYHGGRNTYFSLSYEGVREGISRSYLRTVATGGERTGDFSKTVDQAGVYLPVYDPKSTRPNPDYDPTREVTTENLQYLRDTYPGNRIPAARLDPIAQRMIGYYPTANASAGPFDRNNYFIVSPENNTANGMISKLDHIIDERHRLTAGLSYSNGSAGSASLIATAADPAAADRTYHNRRGSLTHVFTASARTVNTFTFEAVTDGSQSGGDDKTDYPALLGLRGAFGTSFPVMYFGSYLSEGRSTPESRNTRNTFVWTDSFSHRRGKHSLRAVLQFVKVQVNSYSPDYPSGYYSFTTGLTALPGIVDTGHAFASYLLGDANSGAISYVASPSYFRRGSMHLGFGDQYEARKGLNFSFYVGINRYTPRIEKYDRQSTVDLNAINPGNGLPGALVFAGIGGYGRSFYPTTLYADPSASLAWNPRGDTKTVLRLSFGRSYGAREIYGGQWGTQGFNLGQTFLSNNSQLESALSLATGYPAPPFPLPDLRPDAVNGTIADLVNMTDNVPVYQSAGISLERELPGAMLITLGGSTAGGKNMYVGGGAVNPNAYHLDVLKYQDQLYEESFRSQFRPYPQYRGFDLGGLYPGARYKRDAGYLRLDKRSTKGLSMNFYYEFSKQMDDYSGPYGKQDFYNRESEWSMTAGANPHRATLTYMYELPFGAKTGLFSFSGWQRHFVEGWSFSGTTTILSGEPIALHPQYNNTGGVVQALRVNIVPGVDPNVPNRSAEQWFNPQAFDQPADFTIGDGPRTHPQLRGPRYQNHDVSVTKRFPISADRLIEFSAVGLNFLNHANWSDPDAVIGPASAPNVNAGKIIGSRGGRVIQLGARISF